MAALNPTPFTAEEERNLKYIERSAAVLLHDHNIKICVSTGFNPHHANSPYSAAILIKQHGVHRILHHRCIGGTRMEALCGLLGVVESKMWNINVQADAYQREQTAGTHKEKQEVRQKRKLSEGAYQDDSVAGDGSEKKKPKLEGKVAEIPIRNLRSKGVASVRGEGDEQGKAGRSTRVTRARKNEDVIPEDDEED
ncbi:hypothetical protein SLS60_011055 [Paraconiothyrium brasiliense]|uniref:Uncharacterized protein n=1 Tax=Paraconiothyrium brasiliense TaxID=300254 RepID=A0ABR3QKF6_9PLEO